MKVGGDKGGGSSADGCDKKVGLSPSLIVGPDPWALRGSLRF